MSEKRPRRPHGSDHDLINSHPPESPIPTRRKPPAAFARTVAGREPKELDLTLAALADDVGAPTRPGHDINGFVRLRSDQLEEWGISSPLVRDAQTGLRFAVYRNDSGHTVLAFAGTDASWKSWKANIYQAVGLEAQQYVLAARIGKLAKNQFHDNLVVTGHSLGGGLAALAAVKSGAPAVTFHAAGLSDQTISRMNLSVDAVRAHADELFRNIVVAGDPLTQFLASRTGARTSVGGLLGGAVGSSVGAVLGMSVGHAVGTAQARAAGRMLGAAMAGLPSAAVVAGSMVRIRPALGHTVELPDPAPLSRLNLRSRLEHRITVHRMKTVVAALERYQPWSASGPGSHQELAM
ncbi:Mbeg1-like protein [Nocardia sp. NPDC006044]|uniref:Mbeg1-like protein n=1 Tax=Nocardia sp. NPDC006044 TaxID=3364306 RepID=UPI00368AA02C